MSHRDKPYCVYQYTQYRAATAGPASRAPRAEPPLRARSLSLAQRPRSQHGRPPRSAPAAPRGDLARTPTATPKRKPLSKVLVKQQNRKLVQKQPCAVAVQTLSLPMRYADDPTLSSSKRRSRLCNEHDTYHTKSSNPLKQVRGNRKLCDTLGESGTENRLLLQISEAEQVADFERILNSNAILWSRSVGPAWRSADSPRPRSGYSLPAVTRAHLALTRDLLLAAPAPPAPADLRDLSLYYDDDVALQRELSAAADRAAAAAAAAAEPLRNFNVNLACLLGLQLGDCSPAPPHEKEWLEPSMSADDKRQDKLDCVDKLAQNLNSVKIDGNEKVPTITFSNCCETRSGSEATDNKSVEIHLAVPSVDSGVEARPPAM
ncbi:hypothetical protein JYU34_011810 [Plutella xylostella]|uniref:Uncharacterized protein n=1 Tax=Plutella xylostella TaxID=51655 RepID=A0ABQ7QDK0_PLUXY|nr:hypothetical protein JYU34_011810 [Plutella xylostella]